MATVSVSLNACEIHDQGNALPLREQQPTGEFVKIIVLRHHSEDDPGLIGEALEAHGATFTVHHVVEDGPLPDIAKYDAGIVLGAKWSVYDHDAVGDWIENELDWLRQADRLEIPVLGICFGAQAVTVAHGGIVEKAPATEIGWVTIDSTDSALPSGPWFQFHGDQCIPPEEATVLATNAVCVQAFTLRRNLALQFHPELDRRQLQAWIDGGADQEMREFSIDIEATLNETGSMDSQARANVGAIVTLFLSMLNSE